MRLVSISIIAAVSMLASSAVLADEPVFKGTFAKSAAACKATGDGANWEDSLRVDAEGVSGYELGCQFTAMQRVNTDTETSDFLTPAVCGDDSGVTRPDMFWMSVYEEGKKLGLQSQNEYVAAAEGGGLSGEYVLCE
jgi:hypothetical protein